MEQKRQDQPLPENEVQYLLEHYDVNRVQISQAAVRFHNRMDFIEDEFRKSGLSLRPSLHRMDTIVCGLIEVDNTDSESESSRQSFDGPLRQSSHHPPQTEAKDEEKNEENAFDSFLEWVRDEFPNKRYAMYLLPQRSGFNWEDYMSFDAEDFMGCDERIEYEDAEILAEKIADIRLGGVAAQCPCGAAMKRKSGRIRDGYCDRCFLRGSRGDEFYVECTACGLRQMCQTCFEIDVTHTVTAFNTSHIKFMSSRFVERVNDAISKSKTLVPFQLSDNTREITEDGAQPSGEPQQNVFWSSIGDYQTSCIVFWGASGSGKSTACNRLCGDQSDDGDEGKFKTSSGLTSCTEKVCYAHVLDQFNKSFHGVIDTPGLDDSEDRDVYFVTGIMKFFYEFPHNRTIFVVTFDKTRFTASTRSQFETAVALFGDVFWRHVVILLSNVDKLENEERWQKRLGDFEKRKSEMRRLLQRHFQVAPEIAGQIPVLAMGHDHYDEAVLELYNLARGAPVFKHERITQLSAAGASLMEACAGAASLKEGIELALEGEDSSRKNVVIAALDRVVHEQRVEETRRQTEPVSASASGSRSQPIAQSEPITNLKPVTRSFLGRNLVSVRSGSSENSQKECVIL